MVRALRRVRPAVREALPLTAALPRPEPSARRESPGGFGAVAAWLWTTLCSLYLLCGTGVIEHPDACIMFRVTESLLERGEARIEPLHFWDAPGGVPAPSPDDRPRLYSWYGLGQSLVGVPAYLLGKALAPLATDDDAALLEGTLAVPWYDRDRAHLRPAIVAHVTSWTNAAVVALLAVAVLLFARDLGYSLRAALVAASAVGVASAVAPYASSFMSEPAAALGLFGYVWLVWRGRHPESGRLPWAVAGFLVAGCVLTKVAYAVLAVPATVLMLGCARTLPRREAVLRIGGAVLAAAVPLAVLAWYNWSRFGAPWLTGYEAHLGKWSTPLLQGIAGLLLSPSYGLLLYCPLVLLAAAGLSRFWRRAPLVALTVGVALITLLGTFARWQWWEGGWCYGPRFLIPLVPLLLLPLATLVDDGPRWARRLLWPVGALAVVITMYGLLVGDMRFHAAMLNEYAADRERFVAMGYTDQLALMRWSWDHCRLVRQFEFPLFPQLMAVRSMPTNGLFATTSLLFLGTFAAGVVGLVRAVRAGGRVPAPAS